MPASTARLKLSVQFTSDEFRHIAQGQIPEKLEDRWFVFLRAHTLYLHRTGTGVCVYEVDFLRWGGGYLVVEARVNRDGRQYPANNDAFDAQQLATLLRRLSRGLPPMQRQRIDLSSLQGLSGLRPAP